MAKQGSAVHIQIEELELRDNGRRAINTTAPRINQISPTQVVDATATAVMPVRNIPPVPKPRTITSTIFKLLFFAHLLSLSILLCFLIIRGFLDKTPTFRPLPYFIPLLASISLSAIIALLSLLFVLHHPKRSFDTSLWLSPVLTCLAAALLFIFSTGASFALGAPALLLGITQSLYACWINPRIQYAHQILSVSVPAVKFSVTVGKYVALALVAAVVYSWLWALGVGGIAAAEDRRFDALYVLLLLLSLAWTMQVIRNAVHVAISHIAYTKLAHGAGIAVPDAFHDARSRALGDICIGSLISPVVGSIRGMARAVDLLAGDTDEFMFSCASCYLGVSGRLVAHANRWGFVHVGAHGKAFSEASRGTWELFRQRGMVRLIDSDVTGSFCFFCGVASGAFAALVCGSWMLAVDEAYATGPTVYAFIVGYFMVRIGMAWPQACVSAHYVVYAEDPRNGMLGSTIADRIRELETALD